MEINLILIKKFMTQGGYREGAGRKKGISAKNNSKNMDDNTYEAFKKAFNTIFIILVVILSFVIAIAFKLEVFFWQ